MIEQCQVWKRSLENGDFPCIAWENCISQGVDDRGSLVSVP